MKQLAEGLILRTARKRWLCRGNGALERVASEEGTVHRLIVSGNPRRTLWEAVADSLDDARQQARAKLGPDMPTSYSIHYDPEERDNPHYERAPDCADRIEPGDQYVECTWEAQVYGSGTRHCRACASRYFMRSCTACGERFGWTPGVSGALCPECERAMEDAGPDEPAEIQAGHHG